VSIIKKDSYDSVDSYAALFLMALAKYHEKTHDTPFIVEREAQIQSVMHAMETMRCSDGLYMNDLEHRAKYLMDNVETNAGLRGYISLVEKG